MSCANRRSSSCRYRAHHARSSVSTTTSIMIIWSMSISPSVRFHTPLAGARTYAVSPPNLSASSRRTSASSCSRGGRCCRGQAAAAARGVSMVPLASGPTHDIRLFATGFPLAGLPFATRSAVRTLVCCGVLVSVMAGSSGCARRAPAIKPSLAMPRPPERDVPRTDEHGRSAEDILGRVRDRLKNSAASRPPAADAPATSLAGVAQADAASEAWSVVVSPAAPDERQPASAPGSMSIESGNRGGRDPHRAGSGHSLPAKRYVDILGGAFAAICAVLAIRQRVRSRRYISA